MMSMEIIVNFRERESKKWYKNTKNQISSLIKNKVYFYTQNTWHCLTLHYIIDARRDENILKNLILN